MTAAAPCALAVAASVLQLLLAVVVWVAHDTSSAAIQLAENGFLPGYSLGVDGVSVMFLPATALSEPLRGTIRHESQ